MRSLVAFYSFPANTRKVAERAARDLDADTVEVRCHRNGAGRILCAVFDSWCGRLPAIEVAGGRSNEYDHVFVMGRFWAGHAATPSSTYFARSRGMSLGCVDNVGLSYIPGGRPL